MTPFVISKLFVWHLRTTIATDQRQRFTAPGSQHTWQQLFGARGLLNINRASKKTTVWKPTTSRFLLLGRIKVLVSVSFHRGVLYRKDLLFLTWIKIKHFSRQVLNKVFWTVYISCWAICRRTLINILKGKPRDCVTWYHLIVASGGQDYFRQLTDFFIQIQYTMGTMFFFQFSGKPLFGETHYNDYNFSRQLQYKNYSS